MSYFQKVELLLHLMKSLALRFSLQNIAPNTLQSDQYTSLMGLDL